jgi:hypothetical protein
VAKSVERAFKDLVRAARRKQEFDAELAQGAPARSPSPTRRPSRTTAKRR